MVEKYAVQFLILIVSILLTMLIARVFNETKIKKLGDTISQDIKLLSDKHIKDNQAKLFDITVGLNNRIATLEGEMKGKI